MKTCTSKTFFFTVADGERKNNIIKLCCAVEVFFRFPKCGCGTNNTQKSCLFANIFDIFFLPQSNANVIDEYGILRM